MLNADIARGGVMISTWRSDADTLVSKLTLHQAGAGDKGNYSCSLAGDLAGLGRARVRVHILDYELPVAVHSGGGGVHTSVLARLWARVRVHILDYELPVAVHSGGGSVHTRVRAGWMLCMADCWTVIIFTNLFCSWLPSVRMISQQGFAISGQAL